MSKKVYLTTYSRIEFFDSKIIFLKGNSSVVIAISIISSIVIAIFSILLGSFQNWKFYSYILIVPILLITSFSHQEYTFDFDKTIISKRFVFRNTSLFTFKKTKILSKNFKNEISNDGDEIGFYLSNGNQKIFHYESYNDALAFQQIVNNETSLVKIISSNEFSKFASSFLRNFL